MNNYVKAGIILSALVLVISVLTSIFIFAGAPTVIDAILLGIFVTCILSILYFMIYGVLET